MVLVEDDPAVRARGGAARIPQLARNYALGLWRHATLTVLCGSALIPTPARWLLLRLFGVEVQRSGISAGVRITAPALSVGRYTFINTECLFDCSAPITIGSECAIGMRVTFTTSSHRVGPPQRRAGEVTTAPIVVGDGVWIGAGATILPGVKIGSGSIIAAGAVVTRDCEPDTLYAGIPARPQRPLD